MNARSKTSKRFVGLKFISTRRVLLVLLIIIGFRVMFRKHVPSDEEKIIEHYREITYNVSDPFVMMNIIDQYLDIHTDGDHSLLGSLLVRSWHKAFILYLQRIELICKLPTVQLVDSLLQTYLDDVLVNAIESDNELTGFGLYFDYDMMEVYPNSRDALSDDQQDFCNHFDLVILIMELQLTLKKLKINYFIGKRNLIGAIRHHDIIPRDSTVELCISFSNKMELLKNIANQFPLKIESMNQSYVDQQPQNFLYNIYDVNQPGRQVHVRFYQENQSQIFDPVPDNTNGSSIIGHLNKSDVYPLNIRPVGPLLMYSIRNFQALVSKEDVELCSKQQRNYFPRKTDDTDGTHEILCVQLESVYSFAKTTKSWRRDFCEEIVKTKTYPHRILSYFRYACK